MKLYVLTSGSNRCIEGVFTSMELLEKFKKKYPREYPKNYCFGTRIEDRYEYNKPIIIETDNFPKKEEKDIMYFELWYDWGERRYTTYKVEQDKKDKIGKKLTNDGDLATYVYASNRNEAIEKGLAVFGKGYWD